MSKELAFTDDNDVVKYLDTTTAFNLALTANGVAFDLTNAKSILVKIANDDGYIMQEAIDLTTVTSPLGGTLSFPINQNIMNTLVPDDYDIEVWVTMNDGTQAIFPSDGTLGFSIEENLMSDTGEVIPTITLNDFQQQFDDLSSQMENAVHNVHKGDQGNPGNGIKSANNQYQLSDSPVTVPTGGWSDTILATTDQLPYLWTKIIFIYDDGTTKEINFVSSRGDTGSQGPMGPVGPQGKQGNGLAVRGKADKEENLPPTGNNQGDGYLVGTDLYIWIDGSWQNMGSITPDLADYVKVADMNNALNAKVNVTDMRKPASDVAGIEEVSAKQDKLTYTPADDSKVVHSTDMRKPASDVAGIEEVNTKQDKIGYTPADDSKVAHLSGAEEIGGQKTFDVAPIDKTTGNPYITKDGVPAVSPTLADMTKDANFTGKLQKSGIDVATTNDVSKATTAANAYTDSKIQSSSDTGWIKPTSLPTGWSSYTGGIRVKNNILYIHFFINLTSTDADAQIVYPDISKVLPGYGSIYKLPDDFQLMNKSGYGSQGSPCIWINYSFNGVTAGKTGIVIQTNTTYSGKQWTGLDLSIPLETISS